jgi:hypothetical protein
MIPRADSVGIQATLITIPVAIFDVFPVFGMTIAELVSTFEEPITSSSEDPVTTFGEPVIEKHHIVSTEELVVTLVATFGVIERGLPLV